MIYMHQIQDILDESMASDLSEGKNSPYTSMFFIKIQITPNRLVISTKAIKINW